jgi:hypothetical protein
MPASKEDARVEVLKALGDRLDDLELAKDVQLTASEIKGLVNPLNAAVQKLGGHHAISPGEAGDCETIADCIKLVLDKVAP